MFGYGSWHKYFFKTLHLLVLFSITVQRGETINFSGKCGKRMRVFPDELRSKPDGIIIVINTMKRVMR